MTTNIQAPVEAVVVVTVNQGAQGVPGTPGATGAPGAPGTPGAEGTPGATGATGGTATGTSTTSRALAVGSTSWVTQASRAFAVGMRVRIAVTASPASNYAEGVVTAYSGTTLTVTVDRFVGAGTHAAWTISGAGDPGATGAPGSAGAAGSTGAPGADGFSAPMIAPPAGRYWFVKHSFNSNANAHAGRLTLVPFVVTKTITVTHLGPTVSVIPVGGAVSLQQGIFKSLASGLPDLVAGPVAPQVTIPLTAANATVPVRVAYSAVLTPNVYWIASMYTVTTAPTTVPQFSLAGNVNSDIVLPMAAAASSSYGYYVAAGAWSFGSYPALVDAIAGQPTTALTFTT